MNIKLLGIMLTGFLAIFAVSEAHAQQIPDWVKNIAGFWANGDISDTEYAASISYLAEQGIITIPQSKQVPVQSCDELFDDIAVAVLAMSGLGLVPFANIENTDVLDPISKYSDHIGDMMSEYTGSYMECPRNAEHLEILTGLQNTLVYSQDLFNQINSGNTSSGNTNTGSCVMFCDSTGYEPNWAKSMGENQAANKCLSVDYGTKDWDWCGEFMGYRMDQLE